MDLGLEDKQELKREKSEDRQEKQSRQHQQSPEVMSYTRVGSLCRPCGFGKRLSSFSFSFACKMGIVTNDGNYFIGTPGKLNNLRHTKYAGQCLVHSKASCMSSCTSEHSIAAKSKELRGPTGWGDHSDSDLGNHSDSLINK